MSYGSPYATPPPYQSDPSSYMMPPSQGVPPPFMPPQSYMMQPGFQGMPPSQYYDEPPPPDAYYPPPPPPPPPRQQQQRRRQGVAAPQVNVQKIQKLTINKPAQQQRSIKQAQQKPKQVPCKKQDYTKAFQNMRLRSLPSPDDRDPILTLYDKPVYIFPQSYLPDFMEKKNQIRLDNKFTDKAAAFRMNDGSIMLMFSSVRDKNGRREFMPVRFYYNHGLNS